MASATPAACGAWLATGTQLENRSGASGKDVAAFVAAPIVEESSDPRGAPPQLGAMFAKTRQEYVDGRIALATPTDTASWPSEEA